jgi:hypothetical protein
MMIDTLEPTTYNYKCCSRGHYTHVASTRMLGVEIAFTDSVLESHLLTMCENRPYALTDLAGKSPVPTSHANRFC